MSSMFLFPPFSCSFCRKGSGLSAYFLGACYKTSLKGSVNQFSLKGSRGFVSMKGTQITSSRGCGSYLNYVKCFSSFDRALPSFRLPLIETNLHDLVPGWKLVNYPFKGINMWTIMLQRMTDLLTEGVREGVSYYKDASNLIHLKTNIREQ